jgi:DNA-binding response OmpR family regulator/mannose-6-phosphate isomerase-like protein (cupin superfamily)
VKHISNGNSIHILLVEDDDAVSTFLEDLLTSEGYSVSIASCGFDAIHMVKENIYHIIILDLNLPDIDGTVVLKEIKNIDSDTNIVILTGCPSLESAVDTLKQGAYDYIQKPFKIDNIKSIIEKIISEKDLIHKEVDDLIQDIGKKIRELRKHQNISLRQLSRRTGLSNSLLSQVENSKISPSISTLDKIARALNVNIVQFFEDVKIKEISIIRKNERRTIPSGKKGVLFDLLTKGVVNKKLQPMFIRMKPGNSPIQKSYVQEGEEFGIIISGKLEISFSNCKYILDEGDSIYLDSSLYYTWKNAGNTDVEALWITTPPSF